MPNFTEQTFWYWLPGGFEATKKTLCTLKWSAFQSRHVTWQQQPWASPKCDGVTMETQAKKGSWSFLLIPCKRGVAFVMISSWRLNPLLLKEMSWIIHIFNHYLKEDKEGLWSPSMLVLWSLSVQCGEGEKSEVGLGGGTMTGEGWGGFNSSAAEKRLPWWRGSGRRRCLRAARRLRCQRWWCWLDCCGLLWPWWWR